MNSFRSLFSLFVVVTFSPLAGANCNSSLTASTEVDSFHTPWKGIPRPIGYRFSPSEPTRIERIWREQRGEPVSNGFLESLPPWKKETHDSVFLTPDQRHVVSYSSAGRTRAIDAQSGEVVTRVPGRSLLSQNTQGQNLMMVSNRYFVLSHYFKGESDPVETPHLSLYDFSGNLVARTVQKKRIVTGSYVVDREQGPVWIISNERTLRVIGLDGDKAEWNFYTVNFPLARARTQAFGDNAAYITISTTALSQDGKTLFVAFKSSHRQVTPRVVAINIARDDWEELPNHWTTGEPGDEIYQIVVEEDNSGIQLAFGPQLPDDQGPPVREPVKEFVAMSRLKSAPESKLLNPSGK